MTFSEYVNRLDKAITAFLNTWERSPATSKSEYLTYMSMTRAIMRSIDWALEKFSSDKAMSTDAEEKLVTAAMLMIDITGQLTAQLESVKEIH